METNETRRREKDSLHTHPSQGGQALQEGQAKFEEGIAMQKAGCRYTKSVRPTVLFRTGAYAAKRDEWRVHTERSKDSDERKERGEEGDLHAWRHRSAGDQSQQTQRHKAHTHTGPPVLPSHSPPPSVSRNEHTHTTTTSRNRRVPEEAKIDWPRLCS